MFGSAIIVFRESLEAALLIGIIAAATRGLTGRNLWLAIGIGAGLVVLGGLAFNLVPLCRPGVTVRALFKAAGVVLIILAVVVALAIGSAHLYAIYLTNQ